MVARSTLPVRARHLHGLSDGHQLQWLLDGRTAWMALSGAIADAKISISVQLYMLKPDAVGDAVVAALVQACARGVTVQLVFDGVGSAGTTDDQLQRLVGGGVQLRVLGKPGLRLGLGHWRRRNHRKLWVFDDVVAIIGGRNVGDEYYALTDDHRTWHDAGLLVQGPVVHEIAAVLRQDWAGRSSVRGQMRDWVERVTRGAARELIWQRTMHLRGQDPQVLATPLPAPGDPQALARVGVAFNHGSVNTAFANVAYVHAVRAAQIRVCLAHAYFLPGRQLARALVSASRRGVRLQILLPGLAISDVPPVGWATLYGLGRLLRRGAEVRMVRDTMLHTKIGIVDGQWWTVGSANLDALSRRRNLEANLLGMGHSETLQATFDRLWDDAAPWTLQQDTERSLGLRLLSWIAWQFRGLL